MSNRALAPTMIGRQAQLDALVEQLRLARSGDGQVVFLAGEAGVGKTRLLREFLQQIEPHSRVTIYFGSCYDERPAPPYGPFVELLRALAASPETTPLAETAGPWAGNLHRLLPELNGLLVDDTSGDQHAEKRRMFQAIYHVLRPRDGRTHLLVLEDLHWADQASHELLHYLARAIERERVLIIGSYRTDEMHRLHPLASLIARLTRDRRYSEIRLAPLARPELAQMLDVTLGAPPPPDLLSALYARTEGNPFFTEEVLESLIEHGSLAGLVEDAQQRRPLREVAIPLSIKDSILRRVADLDPTSAAVLRDAAVVGRHFDFELLQRLSGLDEPALLRALATLIERQLVIEEPTGPEDRYRFRHELIREALYEEMLRRERRLRHQEVLRALEELHPDATSALDQLAYHALHARAVAQAARYSELAGDKAATVHAYREALSHYEAALEAGEHLPADEAHRADLLAKVGHTAYLVGDLRRAADDWNEALELFQRRDDRRRAADVQRWLGRVAYDLGEVEQAFEHTRAALATLAEEPPCRELAMAYSALSHLHMLQIYEHPDNRAECIAWGEKALAMGEALGDEAVISHALNNIGVALVDSSQNDAGLQHLQRSLAIALRADLPTDAVRAYINFGGKLCKLGRHEQGLALLREGWEYTTSHGYIRGTSKLLAALTYGELEMGDWDSLTAHIEEVLRPDYPGPTEDRTRMQGIRATMLKARGQLAEARDMLLALEAAATDQGELFHIEHNLAFVYDAMDEHQQALACADRMVARVRARAGVGPDSFAVGRLAFKLYAPATLYIRAGRHSEANALIDTMAASILIYDDYTFEQATIDELRGLIQLDSDPRSAAALFEQAAIKAEQTRCLPEIARLRRMCADARLRIGGPAAREAARQDLATARAAAEQIGYSYELEQITALEQPAPVRGAARPPDGLTPRELEVLALITRGLSNRAIAETLVISEKTAEVHVRNILSKLGFSSRTQAATYALERGLAARTN